MSLGSHVYFDFATIPVADMYCPGRKPVRATATQTSERSAGHGIHPLSRFLFKLDGLIRVIAADTRTSFCLENSYKA